MDWPSGLGNTGEETECKYPSFSFPKAASIPSPLLLHTLPAPSCPFRIQQPNPQLSRSFESNPSEMNSTHFSGDKKKAIKKTQCPALPLPLQEYAHAHTHTTRAHTQLNIFCELILLCSIPYICQKNQGVGHSAPSPPSSLSQYVHLSANILLLPSHSKSHRQGATSNNNFLISRDESLKTQIRRPRHLIYIHLEIIKLLYLEANYLICNLPLAEE